MSLRVAVICEDHVNDQYIARPIVAAALASVGKAQANVSVVTSPRMKGISDVSRSLCSLLARYGAIMDIVVFLVDADGEDGFDGHPDRQMNLLRRARDCPRHGDKAVVVTARQEVEIWAIWGSRSDLQGDPSWSEVRAERDPKEVFFGPLITKADLKRPDGGRVRLVDRSLRNGFGALANACPELRQLADDLLAICER